MTPVEQMPIIAGFARLLMVMTACSTFSKPPSTVATSLMAVVCIGMASRKWRTNSTSPKEVQPWLPCKSGMQPLTPMNASAPPMGWLIFSGLTVHAFLEITTFAMKPSRSPLERKNRKLSHFSSDAASGFPLTPALSREGRGGRACLL